MEVRRVVGGKRETRKKEREKKARENVSQIFREEKRYNKIKERAFSKIIINHERESRMRSHLTKN